MRATQHAPDEAERHVTEPQAPEALREWPADRVERWPLDQIKPYPRNARLHSEEQVAQIAASMKRFGVTSPVLVDEEGVLIYGHGRRAAAELLGLEALPVSIARGWSEDEKRGYRITDNQLALNAEWDTPVLKVDLRELQLSGFDVPLLGFDKDELASLGHGVEETPFPFLSSAGRPSFQQMTFTLHETQVKIVKEALDKSKRKGEFTGPSENSNGNALARICDTYLNGNKKR